MALLDLPNELIVQILAHLTRKDLITCQLSNSALYTTINASVLLQFKIALSTFKATDNPSSSLSVSERLKALKGSEEAWTFLRKDFSRRIAVNFEASTIYDLNGGVFLLGNLSRNELNYINLPSSIEDVVEWKKIRVDPSEGSIIDMGFCLPEHDLLTVVTTTPCHVLGLSTTYDIKILLFKLSTGEPHPAAKESTIQVINSHWERFGIGIEIVGNRLVLILTYRDDDNHWSLDDFVFVYDWRNAVQTMSFVAPHGSYSGLIFLTENLILIPNTLTNALEIWDIFSTHQKTPRPTCILQLPELSPGNSLLHITCRGEPNPIGSGSQYVSDKPFYQSAHEAIMLFHIRVWLGDPVAHQQLGGGDISRTYTLFVHRKSLCEIYEREYNNKSRDDSSGDIDNNDSISVPWSSWGPPVSRWFPSDNTNSTRWITTTAGQRGVLCGSHPAIACQYIVLDFNSESLRRAESLSLDTSHRIQCFRQWEPIQAEGLFKEPVRGELPFAICASESFYAWDGALIDEERVLGLEVHDTHISAIEIHHFGGAQI